MTVAPFDPTFELRRAALRVAFSLLFRPSLPFHPELFTSCVSTCGFSDDAKALRFVELRSCNVLLVDVGDQIRMELLHAVKKCGAYSDALSSGSHEEAAYPVPAQRDEAIDHASFLVHITFGIRMRKNLRSHRL